MPNTKQQIIDFLKKGQPTKIYEIGPMDMYFIRDGRKCREYIGNLFWNGTDEDSIRIATYDFPYYEFKLEELAPGEDESVLDLLLNHCPDE